MDGTFYIDDSPIEIDGDNITVKGTEYTGTPGASCYERARQKYIDR